MHDSKHSLLNFVSVGMNRNLKFQTREEYLQSVKLETQNSIVFTPKATSQEIANEGVEMDNSDHSPLHTEEKLREQPEPGQDRAEGEEEQEQGKQEEEKQREQHSGHGCGGQDDQEQDHSELHETQERKRELPELKGENQEERNNSETRKRSDKNRIECVRESLPKTNYFGTTTHNQITQNGGDLQHLPTEPRVALESKDSRVREPHKTVVDRTNNMLLVQRNRVIKEIVDSEASYQLQLQYLAHVHTPPLEI